MGDEKFVADSMVDIIRGIVREEINKTDSTLLCQVKNIYSENAVDVVPMSDRKLLLHNVPNMTKFDLNIGDYVYVYKINNQLDNSFICYVLGRNPIQVASEKNIIGGAKSTLAEFQAVLTYENGVMAVSNYSDLVQVAASSGYSMSDMVVGLTIKKHSRAGHRSGSGSDESGDLIPFPSLEDSNKATSWGGMRIGESLATGVVGAKFLFSLDDTGTLVVKKSTDASKPSEASDINTLLDLIAPRGKGSTGVSPKFEGFKYAFAGLKFKFGDLATKYSTNSVAFSATDGNYLSTNWKPKSN